MRHEVHLHADIPILEGVSRRQIEQALAPLLEYLDADGIGELKSLEQDEPGFKYDEKELILYVCWTGEVGRSFDGALEAALEALGPYCYEAVEVDLTVYHENGEQESKLLFVSWTVLGLLFYFLYGYRHSHVARGVTEVPELAADAPGSIGVAPLPGAPVPPQDRD